jgi:hypothetical protein
LEEAQQMIASGSELMLEVSHLLDQWELPNIRKLFETKGI